MFEKVLIGFSQINAIEAGRNGEQTLVGFFAGETPQSEARRRNSPTCL